MATPRSSLTSKRFIALPKTPGPAHVVPTHGAMLEARHDRPDIDWAPDGVHPSSSGHMVIARAWLGQAQML